MQEVEDAVRQHQPAAGAAQFPPERDRAGARFRTEEQAHARQALRLQDRMNRLQGEIGGEQSSLTTARRTLADGEKAKRMTGSSSTREQAEKLLKKAALGLRRPRR